MLPVVVDSLFIMACNTNRIESTICIKTINLFRLSIFAYIYIYTLSLGYN